MKLLLVAEQCDGRLSPHLPELVEFADRFKGGQVMFLAGREGMLPAVRGPLYFCDRTEVGEFNPAAHKAAVLKAVEYENPDLTVFLHTSYGRDLAPRVAHALGTQCLSGVTAYDGNEFTVPAYNGKLLRRYPASSEYKVVTIQPGMFPAVNNLPGPSQVIRLKPDFETGMDFLGYDSLENQAVNLEKADVVITAGRGVADEESIAQVKALAECLGGEAAATRPVVDDMLMPLERQVGITGQPTSPGLYVALGVSGAMEHVAAMRGSRCIVAVNMDRHAPIRDVADILMVGDARKILPLVLKKISSKE